MKNLFFGITFLLSLIVVVYKYNEQSTEVIHDKKPYKKRVVAVKKPHPHKNIFRENGTVGKNETVLKGRIERVERYETPLSSGDTLTREAYNDDLNNVASGPVYFFIKSE